MTRSKKIIFSRKEGNLLTDGTPLNLFLNCDVLMVYFCLLKSIKLHQVEFDLMKLNYEINIINTLRYKDALCSAEKIKSIINYLQ